MILVSILLSHTFETEAVFTKAEIKNELNVKLINNTPLGIQHKYSRKFLIYRNSSKIYALRSDEHGRCSFCVPLSFVKKIRLKV